MRDVGGVAAMSIIAWDRQLEACLLEMRSKCIPVPEDVPMDYESIYDAAEIAIEEQSRDPESLVAQALGAMARAKMDYGKAKQTLKHLFRVCALDSEVNRDKPGWRPVAERIATGENIFGVMKSLNT